MGTQYFVSPSGNDSNAGTSESAAWQHLAVIKSRARSGDTVTLMPGTWRESLPLLSGLTVRAKVAAQSLVDGSHPTNLTWTRGGDGIWSAPDPGGVLGVWLGTFETAKSFCCCFDGRYPGSDTSSAPRGPVVPGSKSQWYAANGKIQLTTISGGNPNSEGVKLTRSTLGISATGLSDVHLEGIATRYFRRAFEAIGGKNITLAGCDFRYSSTTAVGLGPVDGMEWSGCTVHGGGSLLGHYEDVIAVEAGIRAKWTGCDIAWGGHGLMFLQQGGAFQVLGSYLHDSGGSGVTLVRKTDGAVIDGCWFERCATQRSPSVRDVGSSIQIHGNRHQFRNCVFKGNSKHFLFSATGPGTDNPSTSDNVIDGCTLLSAEENSVEMQEAEPAGEIARNTFRDCIINAAGLDLLSCWFAGVGKPTVGRSNTFQHSQITRGQIRGSAGTFSSVEAAKAAEPSVYVGSSSSAIAGTGSSLTAPPVASVTPPQPPNGPTPPSTPGKPTITSLTPSHGKAGTIVRAAGTTFGSDPKMIVAVTVKTETPEGKRRLDGLGGSDTGVVYAIPPDAVSGGHQVRNGTELSDAVHFTVDTDTPPPNPGPGTLQVAVQAQVSPTGATFSGTVLAGGPLPAGSTVEVRAQAPAGASGTGTATVAGTVPPIPPIPTDQEAEVLRRVNERRVLSGVPALASNAKLLAAARAHVQWMASTGNLSHTGQGGSSVGDRISAAGYSWRAAGENVASGFSNAESVMNAWLMSAGHLANIVSTAFTETGIASAVGTDGRLYWCETFGAPLGGVTMLMGQE